MEANGSQKLSEAQYWERVHSAGQSRAHPAWKRFLRRWIPGSWLAARKRRWEKQQEKREREGLRAHWLYQLVETLLRPQLIGRTGLKALEIGSAPGRISVELWRRLNLEPWGVEYTKSGVAAQKMIYRKWGLDERLVMEADLFDDAWRSQHGEAYDLVASYGFIEHFDNPQEILRMHLELLRPGGLLVVTVPNLHETTWYGRLVRRFNPAIYAIHNTQTCTTSTLREMAQVFHLQLLHCGTLGGPALGFVPDRRRFGRLLAWSLGKWLPLANWLNHRVLGKRLKPFPRTATVLALVAIKPSENMCEKGIE
jgi:SAM-dependent methyltransferase